MSLKEELIEIIKNETKGTLDDATIEGIVRLVIFPYSGE